MIITATNYTPGRFDQLKVLLRSLAVNCPSEEVRVHLVGFNEIPSLERVNPLCTAILDPIDVKEIENLRGFMSCYRSGALSGALKEGKGPLLWLDTDIIVRKRLDHFWKDVSDNSFKIQWRDRDIVRTKFQTGVYALGNSSATSQMMEEFDTEVQKNTVWYADQAVLYTTYIKYKETVQHVQLGREFNDWYFDPSSTIWHCKNNHFKEEKFQVEFKRYLAEADDLLHRGS